MGMVGQLELVLSRVGRALTYRMGGNQSSMGKKHIYEEINDKHSFMPGGRFDRKESIATLDVKVEDLGETGRRMFDQVKEEWGNDEDEQGSSEERLQYMGWGQNDIRKMRSRKRGVVSNVTFYENVESHIYENDDANDDDDFKLDKPSDPRIPKYKRCKSIDIKVLDNKIGESIEF